MNTIYKYSKPCSFAALSIVSAFGSIKLLNIALSQNVDYQNQFFIVNSEKELGLHHYIPSQPKSLGYASIALGILSSMGLKAAIKAFKSAQSVLSNDRESGLPGFGPATNFCPQAADPVEEQREMSDIKKLNELFQTDKS